MAFLKNAWTKYYYGFFDRIEVQLLEREEGGSRCAIIYFKLLEMCIQNGGYIYDSGFTSNLAEELSLLLKVDEDAVRQTLDFLEEFGLFEPAKDVENAYVFTDLGNVFSTESSSTERVRRYRQRKKQAKDAGKKETAKELSQGGTNEGNVSNVTCNADETHETDVTVSVTKCNIDKDKDRDKDRDKDIEEDKDKDREEKKKKKNSQDITYSSNSSCPELEQNSTSEPSEVSQTYSFEPAAVMVAMLPLEDGSFYRVSPDEADYYRMLFPSHDVTAILGSISRWLAGHPETLKSARDVKPFVIDWLTSGPPAETKPGPLEHAPLEDSMQESSHPNKPEAAEATTAEKPSEGSVSPVEAEVIAEDDVPDFFDDGMAAPVYLDEVIDAEEWQEWLPEPQPAAQPASADAGEPDNGWMDIPADLDAEIDGWPAPSAKPAPATLQEDSPVAASVVVPAEDVVADPAEDSFEDSPVDDGESIASGDSSAQPEPADEPDGFSQDEADVLFRMFYDPVLDGDAEYPVLLGDEEPVDLDAVPEIPQPPFTQEYVDLMCIQRYDPDGEAEAEEILEGYGSYTDVFPDEPEDPSGEDVVAGTQSWTAAVSAQGKPGTASADPPAPEKDPDQSFLDLLDRMFTPGKEPTMEQILSMNAPTYRRTRTRNAGTYMSEEQIVEMLYKRHGIDVHATEDQADQDDVISSGGAAADEPEADGSGESGMADGPDVQTSGCREVSAATDGREKDSGKLYSFPLKDGSIYQMSMDDREYFQSLIKGRKNLDRELEKISKWFEKFNLHLESASTIVPFIADWLANGKKPDPEPAFQLELNDGSFYPVYEEDVAYYSDLYQAVDVDAEFRKMIGWLGSNPKRRKTKRGVKQFITGWLSRAQDKAGRGGNEYVSKTAQMLDNSYAMIDEWARKKMAEGYK